VAAAEDLLRRAPFAYFAMGGPYVVPLNFAYVPAGTEDAAGGGSALPGRIVFHTGHGRKTAALEADPRVCIAVTAAVAFDQGEDPCDDAFSYRSLLVWGRARRLEDPAAREAALRAIVARYDPGAGDEPFGEEVFSRTLLYEVAIETAGYKERAPRAHD
jgi:nitroimidazol reductase NimA-like FMN-containing flavoprotein (pyridoxamine 5'-phosphate oxidase superfamily)